VGNLQRSVLGIVERENFVLRFLNQHAEPDGEVCSDHVHESKASENLVSINFDLLEMEEKMNVF
jgi:hypothetical protein